ncbi:MAG: alpha/beta hydrolase [Chryseolinea sp.]
MLDHKPLFDVGEGEPIILLNGLIGNLSNWGRVAYEFTTSHRVLIPRMPFYQIPISSSRLDDLVNYVEEFIGAHSLDKVTLIGNSLGGHIALLYAWRQPSKVRKLVLASSSGIFENSQSYSLIDLDLDNALSGNTIYNSREFVIQRNANEVFERANGQPSVMKSDKVNLASQHYTECSILHHIYAPTLLIWGLKDSITPPEVALAFHEHLPQSKIIFLDQCGHVPMVDQPKLFNQHVREFLER